MTTFDKTVFLQLRKVKRVLFMCIAVAVKAFSKMSSCFQIPTNAHVIRVQPAVTTSKAVSNVHVRLAFTRSGEGEYRFLQGLDDGLAPVIVCC